jgi:hypothetical protein
LTGALLTGNSHCQEAEFLKPGSLYRAAFADSGWSATQSIDSNSLYVIRVVASSHDNPNWSSSSFRARPIARTTAI